MVARPLLIGILAVCWLGGCSRDVGLRCEDPTRYTDSGEIPPVRIPDDLSPPDESESLRIPAPVEGDVEQLGSRGPCLESPPDFYEAGALG
jgi:uncharacterized lipoprotein